MNALFKLELVRIVDAFKSKGECLDYMAELLSNSGCLSFPDRYLAAVKGREEIMSTGIGRGIAIPHARDLTVNCLKIAVCMLKEALDFGSVDNEPVNLVFMIAVPQNSNQEYMRILRSLSEHLRQDKNRAKLLGSNSDRELFEHVQTMQDIINTAAAK
ncbi:MAG: PTS sugar transporter subunit IIA [Candidatus Cloacimonetes bacterium]|jgi:mannitol/fructose-specific phosphotransferase system IIA component (Ntr-type)|nr:PTS sugar transporter subunit IIA [Candidatus Cloacimonadota bacterium]MDD2424113.1 PTS sugar transporter subunit IIA [Candidatus Cloacimonadota bacterium]MDD3563986.1 PTS sugar transporter subunit IIA [Candidatus Cloacimonadota bacterium]MDD4276585.1 PTS sugar transporter subunit IIA [Candidatus Cloacimonadota bacterium]MDY0325965.1 PTS sugar transporter subunit IIA [Candidatus Cloacimonadaceae bacterium]